MIPAARGQTQNGLHKPAAVLDCRQARLGTKEIAAVIHLVPVIRGPRLRITLLYESTWETVIKLCPLVQPKQNAL